MKHSLLSSGIPLILALPLSAQTTTVFPSDHVNLEGASNTSTFALSAGVRRQQYVFDRWDLKIPNGKAIRKVGVRADGLLSSPNAYKVQLEILIGQTTLPLSKTTGQFATNYTTTPITVFSKKIFSPPPLTAPATAPSSTYVMVPLDVPYVYDSTMNLVVDWKVSANQNGNQPWTYYVDAAGALSTVAKFGAGCLNSVNTVPDCTVGEAQAGGYWSISCANLLANSPVGLFVGLQKAASPMSLAFLGAPGCNFYLDVPTALGFSARTYANGSHSTNLRLPYLRNLSGNTVYAQYVGVDVFANAGGLISSNAASATIGIVPQMALLDAAGDPEALYGARYTGPGYAYPVCVFEHD